MKFSEALRRLISVHKCVSCRVILDYENFDEAFCSKCRMSWQAAKSESCPECYKAAFECGCMPNQLSKSGALTLRKLFFYDPKCEKEVQNRYIYYIKHHKSNRASRFAAEQIAPMVQREIDILGIEKTGILIVNVPRGVAAVRSNGFDQSAEICRKLAETLDIEYVAAIKRRKGGREQKKLTSSQRRENMKNLMFINETEKGALKGRYVLLFDDIVTTGASMAAAVGLLMRAGAKGVLCFSLAYDTKKKFSSEKS